MAFLCPMQQKVNALDNTSKADPTTQEFVVTLDTGEDGSPAEVKPVSFSAKHLPPDTRQEAHQRRRRPRSPGLKWYENFDSAESFKHGRVLVIDYIKQGGCGKERYTEAKRVY